MKKCCPFAEGFVGDVEKLDHIQDNTFDIAISSQVIEHVSNDVRMLKEVFRILKPNGYFYVSTVIKKWYGFWIYWKNGFKLDPTHVREYGSSEEFLRLLKESGFKIIKYKVYNVTYPLIDLMIRALIAFKIIKPSPDFYLKHTFLKN